MGDPWNVRLVPHYSLAVFLFFSHLACGLRAVLLGHHVAETSADRIARAVIGLGGIIALVIISAMLGVHAIAKRDQQHHGLPLKGGKGRENERNYRAPLGER